MFGKNKITHGVEDNNKNSDMVFLKMILKLNGVFSAAPYYNFLQRDNKWSKCNTLYSLFVAFLFITLYALSTFCNPPYDAIISSVTSTFLDIMTSFTLLIASLIILINVIFQTKKWKKLLNQLLTVNRKLETSNIISTNFSNANYLKLLLLHILIFGITGFRLALWYLNDMRTETKYFLCTCIYEYYCFITTLTMVQLNFILRRRYNILADKLVETMDTFELHFKTADVIRDIVKIYKNLNDIVGKCNDIFGYQVLFTLGNTLLSVLQSFDSCLRYKKLEEKYGNRAINVLLIDILTTVFNLVIILKLSYLHFYNVKCNTLKYRVYILV